MPAQINESSRGLAWLYSTLTSDATLAGLVPGGWWRDMAPPGTAQPFGILTQQSATDVLGSYAQRLMVTALYQVKVCSPASQFATLASAADRLDALIGHTSNLTAPSGDATILSCYREQALALSELPSDGVLWSHVGGLYRVLITAK